MGIFQIKWKQWAFVVIACRQFWKRGSALLQEANHSVYHKRKGLWKEQETEVDEFDKCVIYMAVHDTLLRSHPTLKTLLSVLQNKISFQEVMGSVAYWKKIKLLVEKIRTVEKCWQNSHICANYSYTWVLENHWWLQATGVANNLHWWDVMLLHASGDSIKISLASISKGQWALNCLCWKLKWVYSRNLMIIMATWIFVIMKSRWSTNSKSINCFSYRQCSLSHCSAKPSTIFSNWKARMINWLKNHKIPFQEKKCKPKL
jgi:hypothetical protein